MLTPGQSEHVNCLRNQCAWTQQASEDEMVGAGGRAPLGINTKWATASPSIIATKYPTLKVITASMSRYEVVRFSAYSKLTAMRINVGWCSLHEAHQSADCGGRPLGEVRKTSYRQVQICTIPHSASTRPLHSAQLGYSSCAKLVSFTQIMRMLMLDTSDRERQPNAGIGQ